MTKPILDMRYTAWQHQYGDLTVYGSWTLDNDQPCIVIVPTLNMMSNERVIPCIVRLSEAYLWAEETGDPAVTVRQAARFAEALRLDPLSPQVIARLHAIVDNSLHDLIHMPSFPRKAEGETAADLIATDPESGKIVHEGTITDVH